MREALPVTHETGLELANACNNVAALITATHVFSNEEGWQQKIYETEAFKTRWEHLDYAMKHLYHQWQKLQIEETNGEMPW